MLYAPCHRHYWSSSTQERPFATYLATTSCFALLPAARNTVVRCSWMIGIRLASCKRRGVQFTSVLLIGVIWNETTWWNKVSTTYMQLARDVWMLISMADTACLQMPSLLSVCFFVMPFSHPANTSDQRPIPSSTCSSLLSCCFYSKRPPFLGLPPSSS